MLRAALLMASVIAVDVGADSPARLERGSTPTALPRLAEQCTLLFTLDVDAAGAVSAVNALSRQPLLTRVFAHPLRRWHFAPATREGVPAASLVLVAVLLRPPVLLNVGPCDEPPLPVHDVPDDVPAPTGVTTPVYPPRALGDGISVVEVEVDAAGEVTAARPAGRSSVFDSAAVEAARGWRFRPASIDGVPMSSVAYLVFGFEEPALAPPLSR